MSTVVAIAPRYPERLLGMIEALDEDELTLAEAVRRGRKRRR
jgi:hypothetical protein